MNLTLLTAGSYLHVCLLVLLTRNFSIFPQSMLGFLYVFFHDLRNYACSCTVLVHFHTADTVIFTKCNMIKAIKCTAVRMEGKFHRLSHRALHHQFLVFSFSLSSLSLSLCSLSLSLTHLFVFFSSWYWGLNSGPTP
jgi:hypothetical protein